jgi:sporulation protein YlmC with PRC-barrel domain
MNRTIAAVALAATLAVAGTPFVANAQGVSFQKGQGQGEVAVVRMSGTRVFNAKAEVIGTIGDIVLGADGRAVTAVINVGGFLGVGSKLVAVPYSSLKIGPVVEGSRVLLVDATKEQLQAAPAYVATDPSRTDRAKKKASDWLKVAKDKAIELGKQAGDAVQGMREKASQPAPSPAPKQ